MSYSTLYNRLKDFIECDVKSCSYDPELISPEYVHRMWGGSVAIDENTTELTEIRKLGSI